MASEERPTKAARINCPVCLETVGAPGSAHPRCLPTCGHTVCERCLQAILALEAARRICPCCRAAITGRAAPINFSLLQSAAEDGSPAAEIPAAAQVIEIPDSPAAERPAPALPQPPPQAMTTTRMKPPSYSAWNANNQLLGELGPDPLFCPKDITAFASDFEVAIPTHPVDLAELRTQRGVVHAFDPTEGWDAGVVLCTSSTDALVLCFHDNAHRLVSLSRLVLGAPPTIGRRIHLTSPSRIKKLDVMITRLMPTTAIAVVGDHTKLLSLVSVRKLIDALDAAIAAWTAPWQTGERDPIPHVENASTYLQFLMGGQPSPSLAVGSNVFCEHARHATFGRVLDMRDDGRAVTVLRGSDIDELDDDSIMALPERVTIVDSTTVARVWRGQRVTISARMLCNR